MHRLFHVACCLSVVSPVLGADPPPAGKDRDLRATHKASPPWANRSFPPQTKTFTAEFDVTLSHDGTRGAVVLSDGPIPGKSGFPVFLMFDETATVYAKRTGSTVEPTTKTKLLTTYAADAEVKYAAGKPMHFRVVVDVPKKTFTVYATPQGGKEQKLVVDSPFEKTPDGFDRLNNIAANVQNKTKDKKATLTVSNLTIR